MTLTLHNLKPGFKKRSRKRLGRGNASGQGTYSGRGLKGQKARTGGTVRAGFEGGRSSLIVQTPKMRGKGFRSGRVRPTSLSLDKLNRFRDNDKVTYKSLRAAGLFSGNAVKLVGSGPLKRKLQVAVAATEGARKAIEAAGGNVISKSKETTQKK